MKKFVFMSSLMLVSTLTFADPTIEYVDRFNNMFTISQVSEACIVSSGDNNDIIMAKSKTFGDLGKTYGYRFDESTVIVYIDAFGVSTDFKSEKIATIDKVSVSYNKETTEILSVSWSDERKSYLITFKEDGVPHSEWLDFSSPVFQEVIRVKYLIGDNEPVITERKKMGKFFDKILSKTTGIKFEPEDRSKKKS